MRPRLDLTKRRATFYVAIIAFTRLNHLNLILMIKIQGLFLQTGQLNPPIKWMGNFESTTFW